MKSIMSECKNYTSEQLLHDIINCYSLDFSVSKPKNSGIILVKHPSLFVQKSSKKNLVPVMSIEEGIIQLQIKEHLKQQQKQNENYSFVCGLHEIQHKLHEITNGNILYSVDLERTLNAIGFQINTNAKANQLLPQYVQAVLYFVLSILIFALFYVGIESKVGFRDKYIISYS